MPAVAFTMEAARVDNAILLDYITSAVALEEPEIGSTDPNIPIHNNCTDCKLRLGMPEGSGDYEDGGDGSDERNAIPTASRRRLAAPRLERFDLGISDADGYEGDDGNDVDVDQEK